MSLATKRHKSFPATKRHKKHKNKRHSTSNQENRMGKQKSKFLRGKRIDPAPIEKNIAVADLIDEAFLAYNAARLREACQLYTTKMLEPEVTVAVSLTGALTPAGLGIS